MSPDVGNQEREREMMMELQVSSIVHPFSFHHFSRGNDFKITNVRLSIHK